MNSAKITAWLVAWAAVWNVHDLVQRVRVAPGPRLRTALGRCHPAAGRVSIHPALFGSESGDLLREVVCHEAAHVAVYRLHGARVRPHGAEWQRLVAAAGYAPTARMDPRRLPGSIRAALAPRELYRHRCPACGAARTARRRVREWRCGVCREAGRAGKLEIVRIPANRPRCIT